MTFTFTLHFNALSTVSLCRIIYFSVLSTFSLRKGVYLLRSVSKCPLHSLTVFTVYPGRHEIFLNSKTFKPHLRPTQPPNQWVRRAISPEVKRPERDAGPSPPFGVEVKNEWSRTATALYVFVQCTLTTLPFFEIFCLSSLV